MGRFLEKAVLVRRPRHLSLLSAVHVTVWAGVAFLSAPAAHAQMLADGIAAVVNDKVITYVQINTQVAGRTEKCTKPAAMNYPGAGTFPAR